MAEYYTPTIDEFHVGFEYEEEDTIYTDKGWYTKKSNVFKKCVYGNDSYIQNYYLNERVKRNLFVNKIRVKYLDKDDIEELGFTQVPVNNLYIGHFKQLYSKYGTNKNRYVSYMNCFTSYLSNYPALFSRIVMLFSFLNIRPWSSCYYSAIMQCNIEQCRIICIAFC